MPTNQTKTCEGGTAWCRLLLCVEEKRMLTVCPHTITRPLASGICGVELHSERPAHEKADLSSYRI